MVICTRNRAASLAVTLESAARLHVPPGLRWELLVVDNGSSDNTAEVAHGFMGRLPLRLVREDISGLSNARNRAVAEARGRYICWTDDDVIIDENWLVAYARAFERHPEAVLFGGYITPVLQPPTPPWFGRLADQWPLTTVLAKRDFGPDAQPLDLPSGHVPWGANYAIRRAEQSQVLYEPELGVSPRQRRVGEEAEVIYQLIKSGNGGWWVPDAQVRHIVLPHRQTLRFVFEYSAAHGETVRYLQASRPDRHHKASNKREMDRAAGGLIRLRALAAVNILMFGVAWVFGVRRRALQFLTQAGFCAGAAKFVAGGR